MKKILNFFLIVIGGVCILWAFRVMGLLGVLVMNIYFFAGILYALNPLNKEE